MMDGTTSVNPLAQMNDDQLRALMERLTLYAERKLRKLRWRGANYRRDMAAVKGLQPEDVAVQSIEAFLDGCRAWNQAAEPSFENYLRDTIDSKVSHLVESAENRRTRDPSYTTVGNGAVLETKLRGRERAPDEVVIDNEWREKFRQAVHEAVIDDPLADSLFECLSADMTRAEIAEYLNIDAKEVDSTRKRLDRRVKDAVLKLERRRR